MKWPTAEQLAQLGFEKCAHDGCTTSVNPRFSRTGKCRSHFLEERRDQPQRFRSEVRFAPRSDRRDRAAA